MEGQLDVHIDKEGSSTKGGDSSNSNSNPDHSSKEARLEEIKRSMMERKMKKIEDQLSSKDLDLDKLKALSWNGVPSVNPLSRSQIWKLLLDYMPQDQEIRSETINRKREEYADMIKHYFGNIQFTSVQDIRAVRNQELSQYEKKSMK